MTKNMLTPSYSSEMSLKVVLASLIKMLVVIEETMVFKSVNRRQIIAKPTMYKMILRQPPQQVRWWLPF
jgi:hypothetical protein